MKTRLSLSFLLLGALAGYAQALPNDVVVGGKSAREWTAEWWKWVLSIPTADNPLLDHDGSKATIGQPDGPVFFLAGIANDSGTIRRSFAVPEGKHLFFPLRNTSWENVDTTPPLSLEELRENAARFVEQVSELHASVDGTALTNLWEHRLVAPAFSVFLEEGMDVYSFFYQHPVYGLLDPFASDGFWVMLAPLPLGTHTVVFGGSDGPPNYFTIELVDTITVVPPPTASGQRAAAGTVKERPSQPLTEATPAAAQPPRSSPGKTLRVPANPHRATP